MGVGCDWLEGGFSVCGVWFILLAGGAPSYVVFREFFHVFTLVGLTKKVYGVCYAWVTRKGVVMICLQHPTFILYCCWEIPQCKPCWREENQIFIVVFPLVFTKRSRQEVCGDMFLPGYVSKFEIKFC